MLKYFGSDILLYDAEWVPDPDIGRLLYDLPASLSDADVIAEMYKRGGATPENPRPYLKTAICRLVAIAFFRRTRTSDGGLHYELRSFPSVDGPPMSEEEIVGTFLRGIGAIGKPQLFSYNGKGADMPFIIQRAVAHRISAPGFGRRPNKPWEGIDYHARYSDDHIDLKEELSGFGKSTPTLHEMCLSCAIPSKLGHDGSQVVDLWLAGEQSEISRYVQTDVLPLYELALRLALLGGVVGMVDYNAEMTAFGQWLVDQSEMHQQHHITDYINEGQRLRSALKLQYAHEVATV